MHADVHSHGLPLVAGGALQMTVLLTAGTADIGRNAGMICSFGADKLSETTCIFV